MGWMTAMGSRKLALGAVLAGLPTLAALIGLALGHESLATIVILLMLFVIVVLLLYVVTRLRRVERTVHKVRDVQRKSREKQVTSPTGRGYAVGPAASQADLIGTIRLLQAQYVGRLDRAQTTLEEAVKRLPVSDDSQR